MASSPDGRLRRRLFFWFTLSIAATALLVMAVMGLVARVQEPAWEAAFQKSRAWAGAQFARDWDDAAARGAFARDAAAQLSTHLELYDAHGRLLSSTDGACSGAMADVPVRRGDEVLGVVRACLPRRPGFGWRWPVMLGVGLLALWLTSGRVARRLTRPIDELVGVVRRIGGGDLSARTTGGGTDELGVVADAVNDMAARIQKQLRDQRELLATVSHELRTPLARVRFLTELGRDDGAAAKAFDDIEREVEEMDALVAQLLASARVDFDAPARRSLDVREVGERALERAGLLPTLLTVTGDGHTVEADPTLLLRALANLLDNAKRHAGGAEALRVAVGPDATRFEVLDRGPGLPADASSLFDSFRQGPDGASAGGLGLGLSLVRRIARAHGGDAWATSREGGGAAIGFSVRTRA